MTASQGPAAQDGVGTTYVHTTEVKFENTVGAAVPGMPAVAATPWLVSVAETASLKLAEPLLPAGHITVGSRVVIDHLGPSKVGAAIVATATLQQRVKNRFDFAVEIKDGDRVVAKVEHQRAAVPLEKLLAALG